MDATQIYGFTPPGPQPGETYVKFLMAFKLPDGTIEIRVRNNDGVENTIVVPAEEALKLSKAIDATHDERTREVPATINHRPHLFDNHGHTSYEQIVSLAGLQGNPSMTVSFGDRRRAGLILIPGETVDLDSGAHVTVVHTNNA